MPLLEALLRKTCVPPAEVDRLQARPNDVAARTNELFANLPELKSHIVGKRVLDFGCGTGIHSIGMAIHGASEVVGVDINTGFLELAKRAATDAGVADRVSFVERVDPLQSTKGFDVILSHNSMEHFSDPRGILRLVKSHMAAHTRFVVSFSPPWYSPYGAHMHYFTPIPWVHLLFPESTVMRVRASYKADGARRYEDVEGGLNRMTLRRFFCLLEEVGLTVESKRLVAVRRLPLVSRIPLVREFLTVQVVACLRRG